MPDVTSNHALPYSAGTDSAESIDESMEDLAKRLDDIIVVHDAGTLAARPVSTPESPGIAGRIYRIASGADEGDVYFDYGTGWTLISFERDTVTVKRNADLTIDGSGYTDVSFDSEIEDSNSLYSAGTPNRVTIQRPGVYSIGIYGYAIPTTPTVLEVRRYDSSDNPLGSPLVLVGGGSSFYLADAGLARLDDGDYLKLSGRESGSGSAYLDWIEMTVTRVNV